MLQVRHAALTAAVSFLSAADATQLAQSISLLSPMLDTLADLAATLSQPPLGTPPNTQAKTSNYHYLSTFLSTLTPLASSHPILFSPTFSHCSASYPLSFFLPWTAGGRRLSIARSPRGPVAVAPFSFRRRRGARVTRTMTNVPTKMTSAMSARRCASARLNL